tara:strand:+ start:1330 stop:2136 length:807 start_codon:yes stop_codon:yes gene_type:complete
MRIKQAYITAEANFIKSEFLSRWNLREYDNPEEPAFFWGLNNLEDLTTYNNHNNFKILHLLTTGPTVEDELSSIDLTTINLLGVDWVELEHFKSKKVPYKHLKIPYFNVDEYNPITLGTKIYLHAPIKKQKVDPELEYTELTDFFGKDNFCIPDVFYCELVGYEHNWRTLYDLKKYWWPQSFCNIKPNAERAVVTADKLGMMGRKTFTHKNNKTDRGPHFVFYKDYDDLKKIIEIESKKIGTTQYDLSTEVKATFHQSDDWLYEEYWV